MDTRLQRFKGVCISSNALRPFWNEMVLAAAEMIIAGCDRMKNVAARNDSGKEAISTLARIFDEKRQRLRAEFVSTSTDDLPNFSVLEIFELFI
jgi:hypothetical protein